MWIWQGPARCWSEAMGEQGEIVGEEKMALEIEQPPSDFLPYRFAPVSSMHRLEEGGLNKKDDQFLHQS